MDRRNPHNSYSYKPMDQAAPIYVPPSHATQRIMPVPQKEGQTEYHYGMPGSATPVYVPPSKSAGQAPPKGPSQMSQSSMAGYMKPLVQSQPMRQVGPMPQQAPARKPAGGGGGMMGGMMGSMAGGGAGGMMAGLSDEHSKKEIQRLSSANDALTRALDATASKTAGEGNMPPTEYPSMPDNTRFQAASHGDFADAPAERVAAQNVGMQAAQQPPQGMQPNPQQANFARSQNPAFNVGSGMPDLSELDEAYKRQGQGG